MPPLHSLAQLLATQDGRLPPAAAASPAGALVPDDAVLLAEQPRVRRLVHRLLGWPQRGEVEDVVQEVFLQAWRHRGSFRGEARLSTWLLTIAIRQVRRHARRRALQRRLFGWCNGSAAPTAAAPVAVTAAATGSADERLPVLRAAMQRLAHADRELLVLRYLECRDVPAIAALLGRSRAAIDQRLTRARARLRGLLPPEVAP